MTVCLFVFFIFFIILLQVTIVRMAGIHKVCTCRCQTAATIYRAQNVTTLYVNIHIAAYRTCRLCLAAESASAAKYIAVKA